VVYRRAGEDVDEIGSTSDTGLDGTLAVGIVRVGAKTRTSEYGLSNGSFVDR
jgi:hypothetical protein